jgi:hypothetical protein
MKLVLDMIKRLEERKGYAVEQELGHTLLQAGLKDMEITKILGQLFTHRKICMPRKRHI